MIHACLCVCTHADTFYYFFRCFFLCFPFQTYRRDRPDPVSPGPSCSYFLVLAGLWKCPSALTPAAAHGSVLQLLPFVWSALLCSLWGVFAFFFFNETLIFLFPCVLACFPNNLILTHGCHGLILCFVRSLSSCPFKFQSLLVG